MYQPERCDFFLPFIGDGSPLHRATESDPKFQNLLFSPSSGRDGMSPEFLLGTVVLTRALRAQTRVGWRQIHQGASFHHSSKIERNGSTSRAGVENGGEVTGVAMCAAGPVLHLVAVLSWRKVAQEQEVKKQVKNDMKKAKQLVASQKKG